MIGPQQQVSPHAAKSPLTHPIVILGTSHKDIRAALMTNGAELACIISGRKGSTWFCKNGMLSQPMHYVGNPLPRSRKVFFCRDLNDRHIRGRL